jgi:hypothetical protein
MDRKETFRFVAPSIREAASEVPRKEWRNLPSIRFYTSL